MKILAMSDIHGEWDRFNPDKFPDFDILVIAGDVTNWGKRSSSEWTAALKWLRRVSQKVLIGAVGLIIPGNHDIKVREFNIPGLIDIAYHRADFQGLSFYGVPLTTCYDCPNLATAWDHMTANRAAEEVAFDFERVDVVVSHGPPKGVLDDAGYDLRQKSQSHIGSERLRDYIHRHAPQFVICGHVHEQAGVQLLKESFDSPATWVYNVARLAVLIDTNYPGEWEIVIGR